MRFEVRYPTGTVHEVELEGTLAVLGRDPSCDLVLNDAKCSRRHAVIEAGPQGLSIRDSGSANGIHVNGKRVERSALKEGDEIRLGEVSVKVLGEDVPGTLVMGPDEIVEFAPPPPLLPTSDSTPTVPPDLISSRSAAPDAGPPHLPPTAAFVPPPPPAPAPAPTPRVGTPAPPPARPSPPPAAVAPVPPPPPKETPPRPAPPRPAPGARMGAPEPLPRPLTATVLAALWLLNGALCLLGAIVTVVFASRSGGSWVASVVVSLLFGALSVLLGVGLLGRGSWARMLQIGVSGFGLLTCAFTPLSAVSLFYMMRPAAQIHFSGRRTYRELSEAEANIVRMAEHETMFVAGVAVSLLLAVVLAGVALVLIPMAMLKMA